MPQDNRIKEREIRRSPRRAVSTLRARLVPALAGREARAVAGVAAPVINYGN